MVGEVTSKTISDLLLRIYELPEKNDFFEHVLSVLDTCVNSEFSAYSFTNVETRTFRPQALHRLGAGGQKLPGLKEISARAQAHPFKDIYYKRGLGPVLCMTDVMSVAEWTQTELYNEVWRPAGLLHDTSVRFYEGPNCYSFFFSSPVPLSEDCRRALELVAPHLGNAHRAFMVQQKAVEESFQGSMVLLSEEGKVVEYPPLASARLDYYYPHEKKAPVQVLPDEVERWVQAEIKTFSSLAGTSWGDKLIARRGRSVLSMNLLKSKEGFMLLFEESVSVRMFDVLVKMGLTHRESEVLQWVCQGKKNSEIALILQVSPATVRKHVEHILLKLCCETRGAAAQSAMRTVNEQVMGITPENCLVCAEPICLFCAD